MIYLTLALNCTLPFLETKSFEMVLPLMNNGGFSRKVSLIQQLRYFIFCIDDMSMFSEYFKISARSFSCLSGCLARLWRMNPSELDVCKRIRIRLFTFSERLEKKYFYSIHSHSASHCWQSFKSGLPSRKNGNRILRFALAIFDTERTTPKICQNGIILLAWWHHSGGRSLDSDIGSIHHLILM